MTVNLIYITERVFIDTQLYATSKKTVYHNMTDPQLQTSELAVFALSFSSQLRQGFSSTGTGTISVKFQSTYLKFSLHQIKMQRVFNSSMNYCLMISFGSHVKETTGKVATI